MQRLKDIDAAHHLLDTRVICIVRGVASTHLEPLAKALYDGGIRTLEVTMNTHDASQMITALREQYAERMWIGAGTVLTIEEAQLALEAGAQFFVTPNVDVQVIEFAVRHSLPIFSGALSPTEVVTAYQNGAAAVKIFPSSSVGSNYIKELQGPLHHIPFIAVGGISSLNAAEYFQAGCMAVGVGGSLVDMNAIQIGDFVRIEQAASQLIDIARQNAPRA